MLQILGNLNEFEVNFLGKRIKDVKQFEKSNKEVYCGNILYGVYKRGDKLVENPSEIKLLRI